MNASKPRYIVDECVRQTMARFAEKRITLRPEQSVRVETSLRQIFGGQQHYGRPDVAHYRDDDARGAIAHWTART